MLGGALFPTYTTQGGFFQYIGARLRFCYSNDYDLMSCIFPFQLFLSVIYRSYLCWVEGMHGRFMRSISKGSEEAKQGKVFALKWSNAFASLFFVIYFRQ
jgi:hypothetical protein